ncbi:hypothetical protein BH23ACT2_BH23ACT2_23160 [soil metagenome]
MAMQPTMVQLSGRDRELLAQAAIDRGISRSELLRRALAAFLASDAEATVSQRVRAGYERVPETDQEVGAATAGARRLLSDPDLDW